MACCLMAPNHYLNQYSGVRQKDWENRPPPGNYSTASDTWIQASTNKMPAPDYAWCHYDVIMSRLWSWRPLTPPCVAESDQRHAQHPLKMLGIDFSCGSYQTNSERIMLLNSCYNMVGSALFLQRALYTVHCTNTMHSRKPSFAITPPFLENTVNRYFVTYAAMKYATFSWNNFIWLPVI